MSGMHGHHDMGHTVAGWTGSALVFAGFGDLAAAPRGPGKAEWPGRSRELTTAQPAD